jgi:hypothetical protein
MAMTAKSAVSDVMAAYETAVPKDRQAGLPQDFCKLWPQAKPILELLSGIAILIPGLGAVAGGVLKGLIVVGDKLAEETCR